MVENNETVEIFNYMKYEAISNVYDLIVNGIKLNEEKQNNKKRPNVFVFLMSERLQLRFSCSTAAPLAYLQSYWMLAISGG